VCPYRHPSERNEAMGSPENQERTDVVIAAGGLGTRRSEWSRYLPKEFFPVRGIPGIVHLMDEIARMGRVRATIAHRARKRRLDKSLSSITGEALRLPLFGPKSRKSLPASRPTARVSSSRRLPACAP
jgi:hypothetical protein